MNCTISAIFLIFIFSTSSRNQAPSTKDSSIRKSRIAGTPVRELQAETERSIIQRVLFSSLRIMEDDDDQQPATTWGRTEDKNRIFAVPVTHDMLHNLFHHLPPSARTHTWLELLTLSLVSLQMLAFFLWCQGTLSGAHWPWIFLTVFGFWRISYNAGLGREWTCFS